MHRSARQGPLSCRQCVLQQVHTKRCSLAANCCATPVEAPEARMHSRWAVHGRGNSLLAGTPPGVGEVLEGVQGARSVTSGHTAIMKADAHVLCGAVSTLGTRRCWQWVWSRTPGRRCGACLPSMRTICSESSRYGQSSSVCGAAGRAVATPGMHALWWQLAPASPSCSPGCRLGAGVLSCTCIYAWRFPPLFIPSQAYIALIPEQQHTPCQHWPGLA